MAELNILRRIPFFLGVGLFFLLFILWLLGNHAQTLTRLAYHPATLVAPESATVPGSPQNTTALSTPEKITEPAITKNVTDTFAENVVLALNNTVTPQSVITPQNLTSFLQNNVSESLPSITDTVNQTRKNTSFAPKYYVMSDLTLIQKPTPEDVTAFTQILTVVFSVYLNEEDGTEPLLFSRALQPSTTPEEKEKIKERLEFAADKYEELADVLASMKVPLKIAPDYLEYTNAYLDLAVSARKMARAINDPLLGLDALADFNRAFTILTNTSPAP